MSALDALRGSSLLPVFLLLSSLVPGLLIAALREGQVRARTMLNVSGAVAKVLLVALMLWGVAEGRVYEWRLALLPGLDLTLAADPLALLFVTLSAVLWLITTIYAIGYLEGSPGRSRFFSFFSLCVTATAGLALAGDLFTFIIFYEALTWATYPLIVHRGTQESLAAGRTYLRYTITGGTVLLIGVAWLYTVAGTLDFADTGVLGHVPAERHGDLIAIFFVLVAGLGVKAALVPLHGWLPVAMVAPAPVSALLHAVAVVKAGAFGIVRVIYSVYSIEFATELGVAQVVGGAAAVTIIYGSLMALRQTDLKRRLAYSTVSQVSYIALGVSIFGPLASLGGIVHLVHQGLMKITLFFCAGNLSETIGVKKISEMPGVARRMPWTMSAFTIAALGMIGLPPVAGFISKWYLGLGGLEAGAWWVVAVLVTSSLLNAAYFLPILRAAWFDAPAPEHAEAEPEEAPPLLLLPTLAAAALALGAGLFAASPFSPLEWARLIVTRRYDL
jgi:multicomponent Na+:H+ antiporter subunit D